MKYIEVHNGVLQVKETADLITAVREAFVRFDSTDCVFSDYPRIRVFVRDGSIYEDPVSLQIRYSNGESMIFCGDVIIGKLNTWSQGSLSIKEIRYLQEKLIPTENNLYIVYE